jgi:uroporphyrinogen decarboxylase
MQKYSALLFILNFMSTASASMHVLIDSLPEPNPDFEILAAVLRRERPARVPIIELAIHREIIAALLDQPELAHADETTLAPHRVQLSHRLGFDAVKVSAEIPFGFERLTATDPSDLSNSSREWSNEQTGPIQSLDDFEAFAWPSVEDVDFRPVHDAARAIPAGMKLLGFSGGVLEFAMDLLGMQTFMLATRRNPELVAATLNRVGQVIFSVFERYCTNDAIGALWLGDDLGHKHGLLVSPQLLRDHVFPWYRHFADLAHRKNRPFILHSCGNNLDVIPEMIDCGIDAKHSFEDQICPVEDFYDQFHDRVAVLGGIDVHLLSVGSPEEVKARVQDVLGKVADRGGYACGSGNSIPNYVPPANFLAMVEALAEFNAA